MIKGIRDLSIAVSDLDVAMDDFKVKFGLEPTAMQEEGRPPVQVRVALYSWGAIGLALMQSSEPGSPIDKFIKRRGEGLFSVTLEVDDIKTAVAELSKHGVDFVLDEPIVMEDFKTHDGTYSKALMNFTKPQSSHGVVFEVQQLVR
jgi:methylmalonyl-CoA/ethylmalonyl-CoA epimerase